MICPCGSGAWRKDCLDEESEGHWQIDMDIHQSLAALAEFRNEHGDDIPEGATLHVRRLPDGEEPDDPLTYNPERARLAHEAAQKRHPNMK